MLISPLGTWLVKVGLDAHGSLTRLGLVAVQLRQGTPVTLEILGSRGEAAVNTVLKERRLSLSLSSGSGVRPKQVAEGDEHLVAD